jgi:GxxExxY protein
MSSNDQVYLPIPDEIEDVGRRVVDSGFKVHLAIGPGLLESAYEHCLALEMQKRGLTVAQQVPFPLSYGETTLDVGYRIDLLVDNAVVVEVKAVDQLGPVHRAQLLTYLRLSGHRLGYLMNFNVRLFKEGVKRLVL